MLVLHLAATIFIRLICLSLGNKLQESSFLGASPAAVEPLIDLSLDIVCAITISSWICSKYSRHFYYHVSFFYKIYNFFTILYGIFHLTSIACNSRIVKLNECIPTVYKAVYSKFPTLPKPSTNFRTPWTFSSRVAALHNRPSRTTLSP